jgi:uncharacterized membrane protein YdbT with pleckstrin-like domain
MPVLSLDQGSHMSFTDDQLLPGETLIFLARQHAFVLFRPILVNLIALALFIWLSVLFHKAWLFVLCLAPLIFLLWKFMAWHNREYILTSRRVVKQEGVLSISSFDAPLDKINNVFHQQSLAGRLLNYGRVGLETASEQGTTVFDFLARPVDFKSRIVHQRELYKPYSNTPAALPQQNIPQLLEKLASLRDRNIISEVEFQEKKKSLLQKI